MATLVLAAALGPTSCRRPHRVRPESPHPRIVSFSPAITQILFDMKLGDHVVGVTRFCTLPEGVERPCMGDALSADADAILKVDPDVILTQTDPSKFDGVLAVRPGVKVVKLDIVRLADIAAATEKIGEVAGAPDQARQFRAGFEAQIEHVRGKVAGLPRPRVLFVMGTDRPTAIGDDNFISDLIAVAGGDNVGGAIASGPWVSTHLDAIRAAAPDVLLCQGTVGQEAADLKYWQTNASDLPAVRAGRVYVVSDPRWSIPSDYASRLALEFAHRIHPEAFGAPAPAVADRSLGMPAWLVTLYRLLATAVVGAALAVGGVALQGLLRNPLAEPYVLGISSGAGVGVLMGLALTAWGEITTADGAVRAAVPEWLSTPVLAFVGALATCAAVYVVAQRRGKLDPYSLVLSGVIINTFNGALMLTILLYLDPYRIADFSRWAMGRMPDAVAPPLLITCGACAAAGFVALLVNAKGFNVLGLGDEVAASSGVRVHGLRLVTFLSVGLMTAAAVALAGPIGFLGLIIPHITRMIVGPEHRRLMVVSGLVGAAFLVLAEMLCRRAGSLIGVGLVPVGIITALCGGPFFLFLLRRRFRESPA